MAKSNASRSRKHRDKQGPRGGIAAHAPFIGCDGEGAGVDELGRQNFMLLRIGEMELYTGKPLSTVECLGAICDAPGGCNLVGYSFGYDVTMILRDLPSERRERLLGTKERGNGHSPYTYFDSFGIDYMPRQYFTVCRMARDDLGKLRPVEGSARTIAETFGFFQTSFAKALKNFDVGTEYLAEIEAMKAAREDFTMDYFWKNADRIRNYNRMECDFLAQMMERLRQFCKDGGIMPRRWQGAGWLAASLHTERNTIKRKDIEPFIPPEVLTMAQAAYYGGRFEITRVGNVPGPIHEYDIRSAYPDAMRGLPCLKHGRWEKFNALDKRYLEPGSTDLFVCATRFHHGSMAKGRTGLCGLPIRTKKGHICWPREGNGVYWSDELRAARLLDMRCRMGEGWMYRRSCDCPQFDWVEGLYDYRRKVGSKTVGYPIKLGINSLYGKLAQRVGGRTWANLIWAGLITARTRAKLMHAASLEPENIIMLATDAVYSTVPLDLDIGERLGQWEHSTHDRMFIVQPGLYWGPPKPKTRGVPPKFFETRTGEFERAWGEWKDFDMAAVKGRTDDPFPHASIAMQSFTGLKLAQSRGKPETAGTWVRGERLISFDWTNKRRAEHEWRGDHILTFPLPGGPDLVSVHHGDLDESVMTALLGRNDDWQDQPDWVDLSIPWKD